MKVVHLMSTHAFSGAENVACQIINGFKNDENFSMIYLSEIKENRKALDSRNIEYYELENFDYNSIKKAIKEIQPDIIHAHDIRSSIMATFFSKNAKIVSHIHANHENMRKITLKAVLFNLCSKNIDKIIWVSDTALDNYRFKKNVIKKSKVLYNVIDSSEIQEKAKKDKKEYNYDMIYLGRLTYQKNPIRLLNIVNELVKIHKDLKVAIVGTGELENDVKSFIQEKQLNNNVDLYGFVANPYKILKSSKIMIMTSRYEGTPMCALEAIACGIPIVTTTTDGLKEIVIDGRTGFLADDDDIIVGKVDYLLSNKSELEKMRNEVMVQNEKINSIKSYAKDIKDIYLEK